MFSARGTPFGAVEPHAPLLQQPDDDQLLYKVMTVENFESSVLGRYLHFQRVDSYRDFPGADGADGEQLPSDRPGNSASRFMSRPEHTAENYYDRARSRTYASCFSLANSEHIWSEYGKSPGSAGKICVVFHFGKMRSALNRFLKNATAESGFMYGDIRCAQIFSINYGIVDYRDRDFHRLNAEKLPNPIEYVYLKDTSFADETELRISLSAIGTGEFALDDGTFIAFPPSMRVDFDFHAACAAGIIEQVEVRDPAIHSRVQGFLNGSTEARP